MPIDKYITNMIEKLQIYGVFSLTISNLTNKTQILWHQ